MSLYASGVTVARPPEAVGPAPPSTAEVLRRSTEVGIGALSLAGRAAGTLLARVPTARRDHAVGINAGEAPLEHMIAYGPAPRLETNESGRWLQVLLGPGQRLSVSVTAERILVQMSDRREEQANNGLEVTEPAGRVPSGSDATS